MTPPCVFDDFLWTKYAIYSATIREVEILERNLKLLD